MSIWYSCKLKYAKENDEGLLKQVTEAFLLDAVSYTEAESRIYAIAEEIISREFVVTMITKTNISEVIKTVDEDKWYKCKISYFTNDEEGGKEKKITVYYMVCGGSVAEAYESIKQFYASMLVPYEIEGISKTNVVEVFPFEGSEESEQEAEEEIQ
jgi:hypothetical protein